MYLDDLYSEKGCGFSPLTKFARESSTFNYSYRFWFDYLFERCIKLFEIEGSYDNKTQKGIKPYLITSRLYTNGHAGVCELPDDVVQREHITTGNLSVFYGTYSGISQYWDDKPKYNIHSPIYADSGLVIDRDVIVLKNTSLKNPLTPLVHHYAVMLGHADVTLVDLSVNARDNGGVPIVTNEKQKKSVMDYLARLFNGQFGCVTDKGALGIVYAGGDRKTHQSIMEVVEYREKLIKSFYSAIGVRSAFEKRNNSVVAEVESDTSLLQINLNDMLECRKRDFERVNKRFDTNWTVRLAKEIDYGAENERFKFAMMDDMHVRDLGGEQNGDSSSNV